MSARTLIAALLLLAAAAAVPACGGGRDTPEATFETLRAAAAGRDQRLTYELHCGDSRAVARGHVREWRARLERKDPPETVLEGVGLSVEEVGSGTLDEAAARVMFRFSPLSRNAAWYAGAKLAAPVRYQGEDAALLRIRGMDGQELDMWLLRERGAWTIDGPRTW